MTTQSTEIERLAILLKSMESLYHSANERADKIHLWYDNLSDKVTKLEADCDALVALLTRIREWDMMDVPDSDGPFWRQQIDSTIANLERSKDS